MKDKRKYNTSRELLQNDSFLRWILLQADEDKVFWEKYLQENPDILEPIEEAGRIAKAIIRLNNYRLTEEETLSISLAIQKRLQKKKWQKRITLYASSLTAACVLLFFFLANPFSKGEGELISPFITDTQTEQNTEECKDIQMIIGEGESHRFSLDTEIKYDEAGDIIICNEQNEVTRIETKDKSIEKNKLIVPKGKRSSLVLADGTKVWINSGTTLEFPHVFGENKREIFVNGEIYLEVSKDANRPFFVNTSDISVKVLGTRFNISSYDEDAFSDVVLVEGKVEVTYSDEKVILEPDQLASVNNKGIEVKTVNVYDYISWKDGLLQFNSESLSLILTRLSRYYDVNISNKDNIQDIRCTGKLVLFDDVNQVFKTITNTVPIKYEIIDNSEIIISKK